MELRLAPAADAETLGAVLTAAARVGVDLDSCPAGYASAWRRAALAEGVERSANGAARPDVSLPAPAS